MTMMVTRNLEKMEIGRRIRKGNNMRMKRRTVLELRIKHRTRRHLVDLRDGDEDRPLQVQAPAQTFQFDWKMRAKVLNRSDYCPVGTLST